MARVLVVATLYTCLFLASVYGTVATFYYVPWMKRRRTVIGVLAVHLILSYVLLGFAITPAFAIKVLKIDSLAEYRMHKELAKVYAVHFWWATLVMFAVNWTLENYSRATWNDVGGRILFIWMFSLCKTLSCLYSMQTRN